MADTKPQTPKAEQNPGTVSPESTDTADSALAAAAGLSEGEVHALRDDAGLNQSAGHEMDVHAWSLTPQGKQFAKDEKDRVKAEKEAAKAYAEQTNKDGLSEAEAKYAEAVDKG